MICNGNTVIVGTGENLQGPDPCRRFLKSMHPLRLVLPPKIPWLLQRLLLRRHSC